VKKIIILMKKINVQNVQIIVINVDIWKIGFMNVLIKKMKW